MKRVWEDFQVFGKKEMERVLRGRVCGPDSQMGTGWGGKETKQLKGLNCAQ